MPVNSNRSSLVCRATRRRPVLTRIGSVTHLEGWVVRMPPVREAVVDTDSDALRPDGRNEFLSNVATEPRMLDTEIRVLAVKHLVASMMPGRENHITGTNTFGQTCQRDRIPLHGIESGRCRMVLVDANDVSHCAGDDGPANQRPGNFDALLAGVIPAHEKPEPRTDQPFAAGQRKLGRAHEGAQTRGGGGFHGATSRLSMNTISYRIGVSGSSCNIQRRRKPQHGHVQR